MVLLVIYTLHQEFSVFSKDEIIAYFHPLVFAVYIGGKLSIAAFGAQQKIFIKDTRFFSLQFFYNTVIKCLVNFPGLKNCLLQGLGEITWMKYQRWLNKSDVESILSKKIFDVLQYLPLLVLGGGPTTQANLKY